MIRRPPRSTLFPYTTLFRSFRHYRISEEELTWLGERVEELGQVVHAVCSERIAMLEGRSEEHTSELQSRQYLVCRLLLEKKNRVTATILQYHDIKKRIILTQ